jgi:hypothetical protein
MHVYAAMIISAKDSINQKECSQNKIIIIVDPFFEYIFVMYYYN